MDVANELSDITCFRTRQRSWTVSWGYRTRPCRLVVFHDGNERNGTLSRRTVIIASITGSASGWRPGRPRHCGRSRGHPGLVSCNYIIDRVRRAIAGGWISVGYYRCVKPSNILTACQMFDCWSCWWPHVLYKSKFYRRLSFREFSKTVIGALHSESALSLCCAHNSFTEFTKR